MLAANRPPRFPIPFAQNAGGSFIRPIPEASQIGIVGGAASLNDGFVPLNATQIAAGGVPPFIQDMNGALKQITQWCQWLEAGGPIYYDATFATGDSGGYPNGAIVQSNVVPGNFWLCTADNNTTDPDSVSSANWVPLPGIISSGTPVPSFSSTVPTGFVAANTFTIGNAASNATSRANADTLLAYRAVWQQFSNTACPIFTSAGSPTTRGANPDADFNANKALSTPDGRGRGMIGVDTMGGPATTRLAGVPVTLGNTTSPTSVIGENLHPLVAAENGLHNHGTTDLGHVHGTNAAANTGGSGTGGGAFVINAQAAATINSNTTGVTINNSGSGTAHNTVSQNLTVFWNIKL